ncbi:6-phosphofructokinase 2 [Palleronia marisminoris]|uniref:Phosphofructokinase n=1 Tax=Palleronia marisminoris TaxID=315423 RepID=A0A1Y5SFV6_9RHOB|nr:1-phosphofructokinase family hexose kinase [Palleronia marisminoris]SFG80964.1 6-phosphofructokinase 2 [Palleronia marisminoris]SLN39849.1 Putative phosphofructokinase PfkB [Palleronia marisminoris]
MSIDQLPAILTVTMNPALDLATAAERVVPGPKLRCDAPRIDPGGGGINVSRLVQRLGGETAAIVALGGGMGERLREAMTREGISVRVIPVEGETRVSLGVTDRSTGEQFRFILPGPELTSEDGDRAIQALSEESARGDFVVLSGSLPPALAARFPRALARASGPMGIRFVVDTSGAALNDLVRSPDPDPDTRPEVLRIDHLEAEEAGGRPMPALADTARFAADAVARGAARYVIVGRDAEGNLLASADGIWFVRPPKVGVVSATGAGDSFLAAMTWALSIGTPPEEALRWGTAAAAATVTTPATDLCQPDMIEALRADCTLERIDPAG